MTRRPIAFMSLVAIATAAFPSDAAVDPLSVTGSLCTILASSDLEKTEAAIRVQGGDFGWHFAEAIWRGTEEHSEGGEHIETYRFTISYRHNFGWSGSPCEVDATIIHAWPLKDASKVTTTVKTGTPSCNR
jgi:hypothetical protein